MVEMTRADFLLAADFENAVKSKEALVGLFPEALDVVEAGAALFETLAREWGKICDYDDHHEVMGRWADSLGLKDDDALGFLSQAELIGQPPAADSSADAKRSFISAIAVVARAYLMIRIARDYIFGVTDILRLRITPATGYIRLQAESAGLLKLMSTEPEAAQAWFNSMIKNEGKEFYNVWHPKVKQQITDLGFREAYADASEQALHSRPWGVTRGVLIGAKGKPRGRIELIYQEEDEPILLLFALARYVGFHRRLCDSAASVYPELFDANPPQQEIDRFVQLTDKFSDRVVKVRKSLGSGGVQRLVLKGQR